MNRLLILGAGGYGKTVADLAAQLDCYNDIRFLDDSRCGEDILGACDTWVNYVNSDTDIYPAFGDNMLRLQWLEKLTSAGVQVPALVHPRAYVSPKATLHTGTVVLPMAVVNTGVTVERGCIINIGALVDHDSVIGEGSHLAPGAVVKAENRIPGGTKIASGTVIENRQYPL